MATVRLKPGHVQPVWAGHPWVYAQAIDRVEGNPTGGDEVSVIDPRENLIGRGFFSPGSAIPVRILVRDAKTRLDAEFFRERIERAFAVRREMGIATAAVPPAEADTTGYRLVHAEGDRLPGLIVDRFGDAVVVQLLTVGMKMRQELVFDALLALGVKTIIDRTPPQTAKTEGFEAGSGVVRGDPVRELVMKERGLSYRLPLEIGQKTGFYFDQRGLRARVEELAQGKRVLDTYSYVGAFAMAAARGGATDVIAVDDSAIAIDVAKECARANGLEGRITHKKDDARRALQEAGAAGEGFDLCIVDPPRLAPSRGSREGALVAYSKLAELGCRATKAGGLLVFCSCSAAVDLGALTRALAIGAMHAGKLALVVERHFQGADHPVSAAFAEGLYLKALVARMEPR
ncbi:MAG: class I SAM-dependent rRNA methyltransferase [Polyangiaceae bacterium]